MKANISMREKPQERTISLSDSLRELAELGSPVDSSVAANSRPSRLEIEQTGGVAESKVFELENGRMGYMIDLSIVYQASRPAYISDVELRLPWADQDNCFEWLRPHEVALTNRQKKTVRFEEYKFPGKCGLEIELDEVINRTLIEKKVLPPRRPISGWLLAIGGLMPAHLFHGGWINAEVVITTSDQAQYIEPICLWTDCLNARLPRSRCEPAIYDGRRKGPPSKDMAKPLSVQPASVAKHLGGGR